MTKATKSHIVHELEKHLNKEDPEVSHITDSAKRGYIVDIMANVRKIKTKDNRNLGKFCDSILSYVDSSAKGSSRIDLVFDSFIGRSIKNSERQRRENKSPIELDDIKQETPLPVEMGRFWSSSGNKAKLESLLHQAALEYSWNLPTPEILVSSFKGPGYRVLICYDSSTGSLSDISEIEVLNVDIEEMHK